MNRISEETRREAYEKLNEKSREIQVLTILNLHDELTPKQVAEKMVYKKDDKVDFNNARPRLSKLLEKREVCIVGKELDTSNNRKEAVYKITQKGIDRLIAENMEHIPSID